MMLVNHLNFAAICNAAGNYVDPEHPQRRRRRPDRRQDPRQRRGLLNCSRIRDAEGFGEEFELVVPARCFPPKILGRL
jgi:hypothetical protein